MKNSKFLSTLMDAKLLWLVYFGGGTFVYMAYDFFIGKTGALSTAGMWQMLLLTLVLSATQILFYGTNGERQTEKRVLLHIIVNYIIVLSFCMIFSWLPALSWAVIWRFSLIFTVIYAGLFAGFAIFFVVNREKLNDKLKLWRAENI